MLFISAVSILIIAMCLVMPRIRKLSIYQLIGYQISGVVGLVLLMLVIAGFNKASAGTAEEFKTRQGWSIVVLNGEIDPRMEAEFNAIIASGSTIKAVHLHSPGGYVHIGQRMSQTIRMNKINTYVLANKSCASACTYLLMGGIKRGMHPTARLGFHPAHTTGINAEAKMNDVLYRGQVLALQAAKLFALMVEDGFEYNVISFLERVYSSTHYSSMDWYRTGNPLDLKVLGEANIINVVIK